jgi:hypothetical protein
LSQQPGCLQAAPGLRKIHSHRSRGGGYIVSKEMVLPRVHRIKRTFLSLVRKVVKTTNFITCNASEEQKLLHINNDLDNFLQ